MTHYDVRDKKDLYIHAAIRYFGASMIAIFLPALLFHEIGLSLSKIFLFFGIQSLVVCFAILKGSGPFVSKYGSKTSMLIGMCSLICYYIGLIGLHYVEWHLFLIPIFGGCFTAFFRTAYHFDLSQYSHSQHFGQKVALLHIIITGATAIAPFIGGVIGDTFSMQTTLIIALILIILSIIPLLHTAKPHKEKSFSHKALRDTAKQGDGLRALITFGALSYYKAVSMIIWPLIIFLFVGNYTTLGVITTLTTLVVIGLMYLAGKALDNEYDSHILKITLFFESINRFAASLTFALGLLSGALIALFDIIHRLSSKPTQATLAKILYTNADNDTTNPLYMIAIHELGHHGIKSLIMFLLAGGFALVNNDQRLLLIPVLLMVVIAPLQFSIFWKKQSFHHHLLAAQAKG